MSRKAGPTTLRSGWWQDVQWLDFSTRRAVASSMAWGADTLSCAGVRDGTASGAAGDDGANVSSDTGGSDGRTRVPSSGFPPSSAWSVETERVSDVADCAVAIRVSGLVTCPDAGGLPVPAGGGRGLRVASAQQHNCHQPGKQQAAAGQGQGLAGHDEPGLGLYGQYIDRVGRTVRSHHRLLKLYGIPTSRKKVGASRTSLRKRMTTQWANRRKNVEAL